MANGDLMDHYKKKKEEDIRGERDKREERDHQKEKRQEKY